MPLRVIFNPRAGSGRAARLESELLAALDDCPEDVELLRTSSPEQARSHALAAAREGAQGVIAAGGDGTVFAVVNGLAEASPGSRPPLGIIPLGTGNAFARDLGLDAGDWRSAVSVVCQGHNRAVDLVRVSCEGDRFHCLNIIGCGFVVAAGRAAAHCKWLGPAAYHAGVLLALLRLGTTELRVVVDGEMLEQDVTFACVANSRYTGTDFLIAPDARIDDGLLDLVLAGKVSRRRLLQVLPGVRHGRHVAEPEVTCRQARRIELLAPEGLELAPDGEFQGRLPALIECVPGALAVYSPPFQLPAFTQGVRAQDRG